MFRRSCGIGRCTAFCTQAVKIFRTLVETSMDGGGLFHVEGEEAGARDLPAGNRYTGRWVCIQGSIDANVERAV